MTEKGKRVVKHGIIPGLVVTFVCLWIVAFGLLIDFFVQGQWTTRMISFYFFGQMTNSSYLLVLPAILIGGIASTISTTIAAFYEDEKKEESLWRFMLFFAATSHIAFFLCATSGAMYCTLVALIVWTLIMVLVLGARSINYFARRIKLPEE
jgi:hypothetical protein